MNQALDLDIHTLSLLLERNYHQHRRCKYYQRMSMVLSSLKQLPSYELVSHQMQELKRLVTILLDDNDGEHQDANYMVRKRRAKEEEEWTLEQSQNSMKIVSQNKDTHQQKQQQLQQISTNIQQLKTLTTQSLPISISRIIHATSPILHEISRGYFVPFLTVALGCLGRIHHILNNLGREVVSVLSEVVPQLRVACSKHEMIHDWKVLESIVLPTFSVGTPKKNLSIKNTSSDASPSSTTQEWNDLMTQYIEVSQDSITKQMNDFVKRKRLDNARLRFGVGKLDMQKNVSNDNQDEDGGDNDESANDDKIQIPTDSINDTADMGELVSMHKSGDSSITQIKSSECVDPNMARIRQHRESTKSTSVTDSSSSKKKKRRKKKRKEQPEVDVTDEDDPASNNVNEEQVTQHSEHLDKATDTSINASDSVLDTAYDNPSDQLDTKKRKKSKKKDKKSKKRKKASSVIDDIFG